MKNRAAESNNSIRMSNTAYLRIGELLVAEGHLTRTQLEEALQWRTRTKARFGEVLTELGFVREDQVISALAKQFDHPYVELDGFVPEPEALRVVDSTFAAKAPCLPMKFEYGSLWVAISDPLDIETIDALAAMARTKIEIHLATPSSIKRAVNRAYAFKKVRTAKRRPTKRQKDRDELLQLLSTVKPLKEAA